MTARAHTPGPWRITSCMLGYKGDIYAPTAKRIPDCHQIARCFAPKPESPILCDLQARWVRDDAVSIIAANARLIAAAPDMLSALRKALNYLENTEGEFGIVLDSAQACRDAIAAVTGGAS